MPFARTLRAVVVSCVAMATLGGAHRVAEPQDDAARASLHASLQNYVRGRRGADAEPTRYQATFVDLNGDGRREAVVLVSGRYWCGTGGCPLWVLTPRGSSWSMVTQAPIVRAPIRVLRSRTNGWLHLTAMFRDDGTRPLWEGRLSINGRLNPTVARLDRPSDGRIILSGDEEPVLLFR